MPSGSSRQLGRRERAITGDAAWRPTDSVGNHDEVTIIKINAITVATDSGDELAERFAQRAGAVDGQDGFEGFELLKPTDERTTWLVLTRWRDDDAFNAWVSSPAFGAGHQREAQPDDQGAGPRPAAMASEIWSYTVAGGSAGSPS